MSKGYDAWTHNLDAALHVAYTHTFLFIRSSDPAV